MTFSKVFPLIFLLLVGLKCYGQETSSPASITNSSIVTGTTEPSKKCTLEAAQMPLVKGARIGSTYDEIKENYPEIETNEWFQQKYRVNKSGLFMIPSKEISNADFRRGLKQFSLNFESDAVNVLALVFNSRKWNSLEEMIGDVSAMFGVDAEHWKVFNAESIQMNCVGFTVYANHQKYSGKAENSLSVHKK